MTDDKILIGNEVYEHQYEYEETDYLEKIIIIKNRSAHNWGTIMVISAFLMLSYLMGYLVHQKSDSTLLVISIVGIIIVGFTGFKILSDNEDIYYKYDSK